MTIGRTMHRLLLAIIAIGLIGSGYALAGGSGGGRAEIASIRPTGVGLPRIGMRGTVGAGDLAASLAAYHDSGHYEADLEKIGRRARAHLDRRVQRIRSKARRRCRTQGVRPCPKPKLALVLDIDETSLSNYQALATTDFRDATAALASSLFAAGSPAIGTTLELFDDARSRKVAVFFITGRPATIPTVRDRTEQNLTAAGYHGWKELILNPGDAGGTREYKSDARAGIENDGYRIVLNVGDQDSDLKGGYADKAYKLPNPFYFISD